jgi:hypothetical protein
MAHHNQPVLYRQKNRDPEGAAEILDLAIRIPGVIEDADREWLLASSLDLQRRIQSRNARANFGPLAAAELLYKLGAFLNR